MLNGFAVANRRAPVIPPVTASWLETAPAPVIDAYVVSPMVVADQLVDRAHVTTTVRLQPEILQVIIDVTPDGIELAVPIEVLAVVASPIKLLATEIKVLAFSIKPLAFPIRMSELVSRDPTVCQTTFDGTGKSTVHIVQTPRRLTADVDVLHVVSEPTIRPGLANVAMRGAKLVDVAAHVMFVGIEVPDGTCPVATMVHGAATQLIQVPTASIRERPVGRMACPMELVLLMPIELMPIELIVPHRVIHSIHRVALKAGAAATVIPVHGASSHGLAAE